MLAGCRRWAVGAGHPWSDTLGWVLRAGSGVFTHCPTESASGSSRVPLGSWAVI